MALLISTLLGFKIFNDCGQSGKIDDGRLDFRWIFEIPNE